MRTKKLPDKIQDNNKSNLNKHFPKPPDWKKVQENVYKITNLLDEGSNLNFTEKFQILDLVTKMYEREFYNGSVIMFLDTMHKQAVVEDKKATHEYIK